MNIDLKKLLTKRAYEAAYIMENLSSVEYCITRDIGECNDIDELDSALAVSAWRWIEGNMDGTMFRLIKNNAETRKIFSELKGIDKIQ